MPGPLEILFICSDTTVYSEMGAVAKLIKNLGFGRCVFPPVRRVYRQRLSRNQEDTKNRPYYTPFSVR